MNLYKKAVGKSGTLISRNGEMVKAPTAEFLCYRHGGVTSRREKTPYVPVLHYKICRKIKKVKKELPSVDRRATLKGII